MDVTQQHGQRPLVLLVAARRADREIGLAVARDQRRRQRRARPRVRAARSTDGPGSSQPICAARRDRKAEFRALRASFAASRRMASPQTCCRSDRPRRDARCRPIRPAAAGRLARHSRGRPASLRPPSPARAACARPRPADRRAASRRSLVADRACAARRRSRRTATSRAARRRSPDRRRTPRGRRSRASGTRRACGRTRRRPGPSRRGRSLRAWRGSAASPAPGPKGPVLCTRKRRDSRATLSVRRSRGSAPCRRR